MIGNGGNAPKVSATHVVAVYDPADGRVVQMHHVVVLEGGKAVSAEQARTEAVEHAQRRGCDTGNLQTLLADSLSPSQGGRFRVDLASRKMVALEHPASRGS